MTAVPSTDAFVRRLYDLFNERRIDDLVGYLAPDVEWIEEVAPPEGGVFRGPAEVRAQVFEPLTVRWEGFVVTPEEVSSVGDYVTVTGIMEGTDRVSGRLLHAPFCHIWTLRDGQVAALRHVNDADLIQRLRR